MNISLQLPYKTRTCAHFIALNTIKYPVNTSKYAVTTCVSHAFQLKLLKQLLNKLSNNHAEFSREILKNLQLKRFQFVSGKREKCEIKLVAK